MISNVTSRSRLSDGSYAFTIIELLAVIAVIGILGAILMAAVQKVSTSAQSAQCGSNLRVLHGAFMMATVDNEGKFPYEEASDDDQLPQWWHRRIGAYVEIPKSMDWKTGAQASGIYLCPTDEKPYASVMSYGINKRFMDLSMGTLSGGGNPILLADADSFEIHSTASRIQHVMFRHAGGYTQVILLDGSVHRYTEDELKPLGEADGLWRP
ncbi:prepilin-type N-terminal cleavage/methylation domain-containing protein [Ruficoccus amylovorans]|uniref:Prepilin-type N-terminal cleavage/methylation domain-containing protein n=1 Tax=Ruficoccus amylovorans TaxID=1804625 RepID=A0A842H947_9BACT|nr:type II secretion system protein [Ruficoccus amylovorans]MBC2592932.1 prepilin-type N-terminal cleavage/methylation domain-containing protein [Ruficoccus amylovorans]